MYIIIGMIEILFYSSKERNISYPHPEENLTLGGADLSEAKWRLAWMDKMQNNLNFG